MASFPEGHTAQPGTVVIMGTGGTIAGSAAHAGDNVGYRAAERPVAALVAAVPALAGQALEALQIAQLDSKDMDHAVWWTLLQTLRQTLSRPDVAGVVITHGTDTLEETAYWLHRQLVAVKPVVLTAAMRPATSLQADGPQNLLDAVTVARTPGARGVVAVLGGRIHVGHALRKVHSYRIDAFSSGDAGPLGAVEEGRVMGWQPWPEPWSAASGALTEQPIEWPWVEIVHSHAGASAAAVDALLQAGVQGLVVAATGNGSIHHALLGGLERARAQGVPVLRATRCTLGHCVDDGADWPEAAGGLTPAQARVELLCRLLAASPPLKPRPTAVPAAR